MILYVHITYIIYSVHTIYSMYIDYIICTLYEDDILCTYMIYYVHRDCTRIFQYSIYCWFSSVFSQKSWKFFYLNKRMECNNLYKKSMQLTHHILMFCFNLISLILKLVSEPSLEENKTLFFFLNFYVFSLSYLKNLWQYQRK